MDSLVGICQSEMQHWIKDGELLVRGSMVVRFEWTLLLGFANQKCNTGLKMESFQFACSTKSPRLQEGESDRSSNEAFTDFEKSLSYPMSILYPKLCH